MIKESLKSLILFRDLEPSELRVVCGDWDIKKKVETRPDQERKVREITGIFFKSSIVVVFNGPWTLRSNYG